jgi:hypothetical protein
MGKTDVYRQNKIIGCITYIAFGGLWRTVGAKGNCSI